jgi:hypothetical protein
VKDLVQEAPLRFALAPGTEAATLSLRKDRGEWVAQARTVDARPAAGVALRSGAGDERTTDARGEARFPGDGARLTVSAANGARACGFAGIDPPVQPFELAETIRVPLRPPTSVDVVARLEGRVVHWRVEDERGRAIPGRRVFVRGVGVELGPIERDGEGGRAAVRSGAGLLSVVDAESGVAAVVEVP